MLYAKQCVKPPTETGGGARYVVNRSNESINIGNSNLAKAGRLNSTMSFVPGFTECVLKVGQNGTPANADDYKILNALSDSYFEVLSQTTSYESNFNGVYAIITRVLKNKSTSPMTIKEIGLYVKGDVINDEFMIAREVLDEPVTMLPGEKHSFTMSIGID